MRNKLIIETPNKKVKKLVEKWLKENQGLVDIIAEFSSQVVYDNIIYGCCPWDYVEEFGLNLKEQGFK